MKLSKLCTAGVHVDTALKIQFQVLAELAWLFYKALKPKTWVTEFQITTNPSIWVLKLSLLSLDGLINTKKLAFSWEIRQNYQFKKITVYIAQWKNSAKSYKQLKPYNK